MKHSWPIVVLAIAIFFSPLTTHAAWYWLINKDNPELGDFVELSALEYAETSVSKELLLYLGDDFKTLMDQAERSSLCNEKYQVIRDALQTAVIAEDVSSHHEKNLRACLDREVKEIAEKEKQAELERALEGCDFVYFDKKLSDGQKVIYHKEIARCKNEEQPEQAKPDPGPVTVQQPVIQQAVTPVETYVAPKVLDTPVPILQPVLEKPMLEEVATSTQETEQLQVPQEVHTEALEKGTLPQTASTSDRDPKQTFFDKVLSFFVNLFTW